MRTLLLLTLFPALFLVTLAQSGSGPTPIDVNYLGAAVEWVPLVPVEGCVLTITGPDRFQLKQNYAADARPVFTVRDERGLARPDGSYRWELVLQLPHTAGVPNPVVSGRFGIEAGSVVPRPDSELLAATGDPAVAFAVEGASNNFFGTGAGASNTTGGYNSFFGGYAGHANTFGDNNSFFGWHAGYSNKGWYNSFFGTTAGYSNTEGLYNSFFGRAAGHSNATGSSNCFFGDLTGYRSTTGWNNCFFGNEAGYFNQASDNSFFGTAAGYSNTEGGDNSFFGFQAGHSNTTGSSNSFFGFGAGYSNQASDNSFFGNEAGWSNTTGSSNCFFGGGFSNTDGQGNSFFGNRAGHSNTSGSYNSSLGSNAGLSNTTGWFNSFFGYAAGGSNTVENQNTFVGYRADLNPGSDPATAPVTNATAIGSRAYVAQSNSLVLGSIAGLNQATSYVNVGIGTPSPARQLHLTGPNAVFRMDRTTDTASFILVRTDPTGTTPWKTFVVGTNATGIDQGEFIINDIGTAVGGGGNRRMTIENDGDVVFTGTVTALDFASPSSIALKTNVHTLENAMETVNRLRGVRFNWKDSGKPAVGLIAEEVNEVVPEVVAHEGGTAKGVNYANLVAVLVEAVKEQQKTIDEQQAEIDNLRGLKAEVEELKAILRSK